MFAPEDADKLLQTFVTKREFNDFRGEVNDRFDKVDSRLDSLLSGVEHIISELEEQKIVEVQVDRHSRQLEAVGQVLNMKLPV